MMKLSDAPTQPGARPLHDARAVNDRKHMASFAA